MRSRAAVEALKNAGFKGDAVSVSGGLDAWHGKLAMGAPEAGMPFFPESAGPGELAALCWVIEDGTSVFYNRIGEVTEESEAKGLFEALAKAEENHKKRISEFYLGLKSTDTVETDFPYALLGQEQGRQEIMEGGIEVREALKWADGRELNQVLELLIALETNAYDLFIRMGRKVTEHSSVELFSRLSDEERQHTNRLTELFESRL